MYPTSTARRVWSLLTVEQRRGAVLLFGLMLMGMIFETLGVGLVIPALAVMTQPDIGARYPVLVPGLNLLGNPTQEKLIALGLVALVAVYACKALFLSYLAWWETRFIYDVRADMSQRLFDGYLRQSYTFHLQRNSAQLIRNVVNETSIFAHTGLSAGMVFLTEALILLGISALLVAVEPLGTLLVMGLLGALGWIYHGSTRHLILRWGAARQLHDGLRIQHLQQGLGGVKEVKLLGREISFSAQYRRHNLTSARMGQRQTTLQALPKFWLEFLAVGGLAILAVTMVLQGTRPDALLPILGLFAAAAFRLMPSVSRVLGSVQNVRYALPVIDVLYSELCLPDTAETSQHGSRMPFEHALNLDQVRYQYPAAEVPALSGISCSIRRGASVGFIGGSGAGKSTLVDIILGLLEPDGGTVKVDDLDIQTNLRGWQDQIGYVPQTIYLIDDTLRRNVAFGIPDDSIDEAAISRAIRAAQLETFVSDLPQGLDTLVGERGVRISGGQRQRIGIARALYHDPPVLVLDEATSSLDVDTERGVMEAVRAFHGEKTLIIVAHRFSTVEACDYIYRLGQGRVIQEGAASLVLGQDSEIALK